MEGAFKTIEVNYIEPLIGRELVVNSGDKACEVLSKIFGIKIRIELLAFSIAFSAG